jgi:hypothetical protein
MREAISCYNEGIRCLKTGDFSEAVAQLRTAAELCSEDEETFAALCLAVDEAESEDSTLDGLMVRLWSFPDGAAFQLVLRSTPAGADSISTPFFTLYNPFLSLLITF